MDIDKNTTQATATATASANDTDSFIKVKSKKGQKRKHDGANMDTEEPVASKRPQFPPISSDKLQVKL